MVRVPVYLHNRYYVWTCGGKTQQQELTRAERTQCPPYAISEKSILEAVCTANLHKLSEIMKEIRNCAARTGLKPSISR